MKFKNVRDDYYYALNLTAVEPEGEFDENFERAINVLVDAYLEHGKYEQLASFLISEYPNGGGEDSLTKLFDWLLAGDQIDGIERVWSLLSGAWRNEVLARREANNIARYLLTKLSDRDSSFAQHLSRYANFAEEPLPKPLTSTKDEQFFWHCIEQAKQGSSSALGRGAKLTEVLSKYAASDIKFFQKFLYLTLAKLYSWDLWAVAYIANRGCDDDGFESFRAWVVSEGSDVYNKALSDPESVAPLIKASGVSQLENIVDSAPNAYVWRTGNHLSLSRKPLKKPTGQSWTDDELPVRFKVAWSLFDTTTTE